jgi:hypothetical protein
VTTDRFPDRGRSHEHLVGDVEQRAELASANTWKPVITPP